MDVVNKPRSKTFISMDSFWYEGERLATFIDWPVPFISSQELAQEGFYYLRTKDHCACAFCRGIIGAWEEGDTPRGEHKRHFPHCPFVQGKVTPNVPLKQGNILSRVSMELSADAGSSKNVGEDVCGSGKEKPLNLCTEGRILTKSSTPELSMSNLGFRQYCGPKRKEFLTFEVRLNSFKHWPEKVIQTPKELSEAGFYYCGLSDHVRCFHCGNGLRNWEPSDKPWEEHARWFPDCHYVLLKKGIEFIDKVRRERPPYVPIRSNNHSLSVSSPGKNSSSVELSDDELDNLMELEIMKHVLEMGFSKNVVGIALRKKVMESGHPFFSIEACIDAVLLAIDDETKNAIQGCEDITSQARKMAIYESAVRRRRSQNISSIPPSSTTTSSSTVNQSQELQMSGIPLVTSQDSSSTTLTPLPNNNANISATTSLNSLPSLPNVSLVSPLRSSTPTSQMRGDVPSQGMEVEESANEVTETPSDAVSSVEQELNTENNRRDYNADPSNQTQNTNEGHDDVAMELQSEEVVPLINEADDIMEKAAKILSPPSSVFSQTSASSSSISAQEPENDISVAKKSDLKPNAKSSQDKPVKTTQHAENLALELEKMREDQMCKVCMDSKMDVVFLPCTHMVTCSSCAVALASCPICRRDIQYAFKPIIP